MRLACALTAATILGPMSMAHAAVTRSGRVPAAPRGSQIVGELAPALRIHVTVALKPRDPAALAAYAQAVSTFGSGLFHDYLTPAQFARRFGASAAAIGAVRGSLEAAGLTPGRISTGGLSIPVVATAGQLERGLRISLRRLSLPNGRTAVIADVAPALQPTAAHAVQAIVGLSSVAAPHPLVVRPPRVPSRLPAGDPDVDADLATGGPQPCSTARTEAGAQDSYTADQIAAAYGFAPLYRAGDRGAGVTVAVYELEPVDHRDISGYQSCYGTHASVSYVPVDGGNGKGPGTGEAALDIENLIGLAPRAKLLVYQARNSNSGAPGSGPFDTFSAIVNQDRAKVVSISWGECEDTLGAANAGAEGELFEQAAVQGQTVVAASGDSGSEDCVSNGSGGQTQPAVDDPSSQPFVTGVGGTTLTAIGPRPTEGVWNTGLGSLTGLPQDGASGGGISDLWPMPTGQRDAAAALNVLAGGVTGSQCGHPGGYCREVPDVAADGDPTTGYTIYFNGSGDSIGSPQGWQAIGGTSGAAPVWAALMALADASPACSAGPVGYALPALYRAASTSYAADFNDVRSGDNDFTGTNGGRFPAGLGYDEASGLGSPNAASLVASLCAVALRMTRPDKQRSRLGASVRLQLHVQAPGGGTIRFHVSGLPPGLSLNPATGQITGRPRRAGSYHVVATAQDGRGALAGARFEWSIGSAPRIAHLSLTGVDRHRPALSFTLATGKDSPPIGALELSVPPPLRLSSTNGVTVSAPRGGARSTAQLTAGALRIDLQRGFRNLEVTVRYPALQTSRGRLANARGRRAPRLTVTILDAGTGASHLHPRI